jgi:glycosyltransferase involved in cell wall biosynthesis
MTSLTDRPEHADRTGVTPRATVVVPSRNRPSLVRRTVRSLLEQQEDTAVIVVDDGSEMRLDAVFADLLSREGQLTVLRNDRSRGVAAARNRGLAAVDTPWVGFCDDDDLWAPTKVATQLAAAERSGAGWSCSAAVTVDDDLAVGFLMAVPSAASILEDLLTINVIPGGASSVLARTALVRDLGGWDPALSTLADWDLWIRLAEASELVTVPAPLTAYTLNHRGMSLDTHLLESDLVRLQRKRAEAGARPLQLDWVRWLDYLSDMNLRAGRRLRSASTSVRAFRAGAPPARLAKALVALARPTIAARRSERRRHERSPQLVLDQGERWVSAFRGELRAPVRALH